MDPTKKNKKNVYTTLGRQLFKGGDYSRGATIQGNTVESKPFFSNRFFAG